MADYTQPDVVNKRVRFFDGQFLQDQDFIDEQKYHLDRERRQSRLLSVTGIFSGLTVVKGEAYQVTVSSGMAVDALGRQLVLAAETSLRLSDKFANKQDIELRLAYQEIPTDLAQTGGEGARRWDESPKIVALAPDGTVAVAPDGVSPTWDGPTVLLATLAVAAAGAVTVNTAAADRANLSVPGAVGIGAGKPDSDLQIGNFDTQNRYLTLKVSGGNQYRSGIKMWAWQQNYGYSVEYDERGATGNGLHVRTHNQNADGTTRLFVGWNGNVGIGTTGPPWKLSVSSSKDHLALYRESAETVGGANIFLELAQIDKAPAGVPEVFPAIRFHHHNRFWHRIEGQGNGFHFKTGNPASNDYSDIRARNIYAGGKLEVTGGGGLNVDLLVNGRLRSNNNDGGLWVAEDRFVGGHNTNKIGFWNGGAWRLTVLPNGNVGIGTNDPNSDLQIGNFDTQNRYLTLKVAGGNQYRSGVKLWAWQENYGYSVEYDERGATGNGLHVRTHNQNADGTTRLFVGWNGNVGIGTTGPPWKLSVSSSKDHLALYREPTETVGGTHIFLELAQIDKTPAGVPEVFPCIRFHHHNRFWHRIEAQGGGFHFKTGAPASNDYSEIRARSLRIGETTVGETELAILKKISSGNLFAILEKLAGGNLEFDLYNVKQDEYVYAADYAPYDDDRRRVFTWRPKGRINQGRWRIHYPS